MKYYPKKSFFLRFLLYFSVTLVVLGVTQFIMGGLRFYNASEQNYEKLSPKKIYVTLETTEPIPEKTAPKEENQKISYYVAENQNSLESSRQEITNTTIQAVKNNTSTLKTPELVRSTKKDDIKKTRTSPIEILVTPEEDKEPKGYRETILTVITGRYFLDALWKFPIIIDTERTEPRGQMYNESITLGSGIKSLPEVSKVLVHEIGHMIDIYTFKQGIRKSDISEDFYRISWKDPTTIKAGVPQTSFVSGYASTNQYEDFAESFAMYVFHNKEFSKRAENNEYLKRKYTFLKTRVFGDAFLLTEYEKDPVPKKIWDVTKIAIKGNNISVIFAWINKELTYRS